MRNKFFFGAFAVLVVIFVFFMFFTRVGRAQASLPEPILGAPQGPAIANIPPVVPPVVYVKTAPSPGQPAPVGQDPLPVEEETPAPPSHPAPGGRPDDPGTELPNPVGAPAPALPDGPIYS